MNRIVHQSIRIELMETHSIIGKYEQDEVKPSIDVVKNIVVALDTTVGYVLSKSKKHEVLKDTAMLKGLYNIVSFPD